MNRKALLLALGAAVVVIAITAGVPSVLVAADALKSPAAEPYESSHVVESAAVIPFAVLAPQQLDPAYQVEASDIVLVGRVVQVNEARWNSPDGLEWRGTTEEDMPIVYTTFYVEPDEILKGSPQWGTPVAFRTLGGLIGNARTFAGPTGEFADVAVGERVIVMGVDQPFYGGSYETPAYWSLVNATSVYRDDQGTFRRISQTGNDDDQGLLTEDQARMMVLASQ